MFFGGLQETAQTESCLIESQDVTNVRDLVVALSEQFSPSLINALNDETAMVSVNQQYAGWDVQLNDADEVGFLPPVSGG